MEPVERKTSEPDPLLGVVFSIEAVRDICQEVLAVGGEHLSEVSPEFLWLEEFFGCAKLIFQNSFSNHERARNCGTFGGTLKLIY